MKNHFVSTSLKEKCAKIANSPQSMPTRMRCTVTDRLSAILITAMITLRIAYHVDYTD